MSSRRRTLSVVIITVIGVLVVEAIVVLAGAFSGLYNVAATRPHIKPVEWLLGAAMERCVEVQARGIKAPPEIPPAEGAADYDRVCVTCHGAPGVQRSPIGQGLYPLPPHLQETADEWTVEQVYWLAKHGVKDTGMPAFGATQNEHELWAMAYLVKRLPSLKPDEYQEFVSKGSGGTSNK